MKAVLLIAASLVGARPAAAGAVTVEVTGVRAVPGRVHVAVCEKRHFMKPSCPIKASAPAEPGGARVVFGDVAPGRYAVMVFQDLNANGRIDLSLMGSKEPWGVSGPAAMIPSFARSAVEIGAAPVTLSVPLRQ